MRIGYNSAFLFLFLTLAELSLAQSEITSPVEIKLERVQLSGGVYKYGIYAALGGSTTPQLYELDTGGTGFYPVFGPSAPYTTPAWGTNYTLVQPGISMAYASDNVYYGNAVATTVALYSADGSGGHEGSAAVISGPGIVVGQTTTITNTGGKASSGNWPSETPPVDQHFYGDFGLSLQYATNGIMNVLSQLNYGTNAIPGFVIKLGNQDSDDAKISVGVETDFATRYPIQINIRGQDTNNLFPVASGGTNALPTYSGAVLSAIMTLSNATYGSYTNVDMPIVLDTGASGTLYVTNGISGGITNFFGPNSLDDGVDFDLVAEMTDGTNINLFSKMTGSGEGDFMLSVTYRSNFTLNIGQYIFHEYEVAYNMQDGILGLRAIPEAHQVGLMAVGCIGLIALAIFRTTIAKHRRRRSRNGTNI